MPNTNTKNSHRVPIYRRPIFIIGLILVVAITILIIILATRSSETTEAPASSTPTSSTPSSLPSEPSETPAEQPAGPVQYEGGNPNLRADLSGHIAYHNLNRDRGVLTIMVSIDQYLTTGGNCHLQLEHSTTTAYSADLPAEADVTTSLCGPFEVPLSELSSGQYTAKITISAADRVGYINELIEI